MKKVRSKELRIFYIIESEYGLDFKRYVHSFHKTLLEANLLKKYLDIKSPYDKHEVIQVKEYKK